MEDPCQSHHAPTTSVDGKFKRRTVICERLASRGGWPGLRSRSRVPTCRPFRHEEDLDLESRGISTQVSRSPARQSLWSSHAMT